MRDVLAAGAAAGRGGRSAGARMRRKFSLRIDARRLVVRRWRFRGGICPISTARAGLDHRLAAPRRSAKGDAMVLTHVGQAVLATDDAAVALNTALMGDGAVIHVADGRCHRAADPSVFVAIGRHAEFGVHRARWSWSSKGAQATLDRKPRRRRRRRLSGQRRARDWSSATMRRSTTSRSTRDGDGAACRQRSLATSARTCASTPSRSTAAARGAQPEFPALCRRGHARRHPRRQPAAAASSTPTPRC